jgi:hypothetical protein
MPVLSARATQLRRRLSQAAERSLSGRRRSSVFWIAGGTYAWSRAPMSVRLMTPLHALRRLRDPLQHPATQVEGPRVGHT